MRDLKAATDAAIVLITHDLGVVAEVCDDVAVMYAGEVVEQAPVEALFAAPEHPYTVGLMGSLPRLDQKADRLAVIDGVVPDMSAPPPGCRFAPRCPFADDACRASRTTGGRLARQASSANGQRGAKRQPGGGALRSGTTPSITASCSAFWSSRGSEPISPTV